MMQETLVPRDQVVVRNLTPRDLDAVIGIDARILGRRREEFFQDFPFGPFQVERYLPELHKYVTGGGAFLVLLLIIVVWVSH